MCIAIIIILHYLFLSAYTYFKNRYMPKNPRNIENEQIKKYKEIVEEMAKKGELTSKDDNPYKMSILEKREMYDELCQLVSNSNIQIKC